MKLKEFESYKKIVIQCHDNPDADALASGFGLYHYFLRKKIPVAFLYSGSFCIRKSNLVLMIKELGIPVEYIEKDSFSPLGDDELLITVDCQYGAGNVTKLPAKQIAVIDHHQPEAELLPFMYIDSSCGSCSTIVWRLLKEAHFPVNQNEALATALYYGLYTDTNQLSEIHNPYDKDMRDELLFDKTVVTRLRNCNFSLDELEIAGVALLRHIFNEANHYAVIKARPCDPNILGLINDLMLQVDLVDISVVCSELTDGIKLSVRSCIKEVRANELAQFLTEGIGSGGGHMEKAGGFISERRYNEMHPGVSVETYLSQRLDTYFAGFDILYAKEAPADISDMVKYKKKRIPAGFVKSSDILPAGTPVLIRTLHGDVDIAVSDDAYIMIGLYGDIYPIDRKKFENSYEVMKGTYKIDASYAPTVKNLLTGESHRLMEYARTCISRDDTFIYAKPVEKAVKVFPLWEDEKYLLGKKGDFLAVRPDDFHDIYIIEKDIFTRIYEAAI